MNFKGCLIVFFCIFCFVHFVFSVDKKKNTSAYRVHVVNKGETAYSIASSYNITIKELFEFNPKAEKGIKENQSLKIPLTVSSATPIAPTYVYHSINVKETLYSVSKLYNISQEDILVANPGLTIDNFTIGKAIRIPSSPLIQKTDVEVPRKPIEHNVKAKETLYSISKQYNVSVEDIQLLNPEVILGLKQNTTILIPQAKAVTDSTKNIEFVNKKIESNQATTMKIGVLLPFQGGDETQTARIVEYYEGFLLAVENLKTKGYSSEIYTFDIGTDKNIKKLENLLGANEIKDLDLLIGGFYPNQIEVLKSFSKRNDIKYVIPFPVKGNGSTLPSTVFQVNAPHAYVYSKAATIFTSLFKNDNVIILSEEKSADDKKEFIAELKSKLSQSGVKPKLVSLSDLAQNMSSTQKNVIVPTSSSQKTLGQLFIALHSITNQNSNLNISLFGYPDWQTYSSNFSQDFYKYDTYLYTPFYMEADKADVKQLLGKYRSWYGKVPLNTYPKYSLFGYDTGLYFMSAMSKFGPSFPQYLSDISVSSLQTPFKFLQLDGTSAGFMNTGLYLIHYQPNTTVEKIDYSK